MSYTKRLAQDSKARTEAKVPMPKHQGKKAEEAALAAVKAGKKGKN